jgi:hypothetical protein
LGLGRGTATCGSWCKVLLFLDKRLLPCFFCVSLGVVVRVVDRPLTPSAIVALRTSPWARALSAQEILQLVDEVACEQVAIVRVALRNHPILCLPATTLAAVAGVGAGPRAWFSCDGLALSFELQGGPQDNFLGGKFCNCICNIRQIATGAT